MKKFLILILPILLGSTVFGQTANDTAKTPYWIDMMQDESVNFYQTQRAFNTYWKGRKRSKGDGYNPYKRWEWFMETEILPNGDYRKPKDIQQAVMQFRNNNQPAPAGSGGQASFGIWQNLGPIKQPVASSGQPNGMGRINAIGVHPTNDSIVFVGSPNGGIWRTYDKGKTWTSNTDTNFVMQISSIVFDPKNPSIVYAGTGDRDAGARSPRGVMKSIDGGIHWSVSNTGMGNKVVGKLIIDPDHPDTLIAATSTGIYRSLNAGLTWTNTSANSNHFKDLVANPGNFKYQYAATGGKYYLSTNGGATWANTYIPKSGARIAIAVTPDDPSYLYLVQTSRTAFVALMHSKDSGRTFTVQSTTPNIMDWSRTGSGTGGQAWYDLDISVDPKNKSTVFVGGINIWKSTNEGKNWSITAHWTGSGAPAVHADHHVMEWSADGNTLYDGGDGGVSYTRNTGSSWVNIGSGLAISEVYKIGQHAYREDRTICGYQDNGSAIYRGSGNWTTEIGGDGMECAFDPENSNYVYGELYYGAIRRSRNGGSSFGSITGGITETGAWVSPFILNEGDAKIMYVGMNANVWRTMNVRANSVTWSNISSSVATGGGAWSVLESSPANPDILYAVRSGKRLFRTDNARASSPTWVNLTNNLPNGSAPSDMEAHPWNQNIIYITSGSKVHVSANKGLSWTDISRNLPNTAKRTLVYDKFSNGGIYVGGTPNVYYIDSSMSNWIEYSYGFPGDVSVTELEMFYDTLNPVKSRLRAGTYGRGLWSVELSDINNRKSISKIMGDSGFFCTNQIIKLNGDSSCNADSYSWSLEPNTGFTFQNGTSASSKNIELQFQKSGIYSLRLIVSNYYGNDTVLWSNKMIAGDIKGGYCSTTTGASTVTGNGIFRVELEEIDRSSAGYNGTNSNVNQTCNEAAFLYPDSLYSISITTGSTTPEYAKVYIDYNNDGDFTDVGEEVASIGSGTGKRSVQFRTSNSPFPNNSIRMRVVSDVNQIASACASLSRGESEDYSLWFDVPEVNMVFSDTLICPNEAILIEADWTGKVDSVLWDFGQYATPQFANGKGPHRVKYANSGSWKVGIRVNAYQWFYDSIAVRLAPVADLVLDTVQSDLCEGGDARFRVNKPNGISGSYQWFKNGNLLIGAIDSTLTVKNLNAFFTYEYQVITSNGICSDTSIVFDLQPHDRPVAWIGIVKTIQCEYGNNFEFKDVSIFNGKSMTRTWNFGDGNSDTAKNVNHHYSGLGNFTAQLITLSDQGCADTSTQVVTVKASPDSNFTATNTQAADYLFEPSDLTLKSYKWDFGDGNASTSTKPTHSYLSTGSFTVKMEVENNDDCPAESEQVINAETTLSTKEFSSVFGLQMYPNPTHGKVKLKLNSSKEVKIKVLDSRGRVVVNNKINLSAGTETEINLESKGHYLIILAIDGLTATYKIESL